VTFGTISVRRTVSEKSDEEDVLMPINTLSKLFFVTFGTISVCRTVSEKSDENDVLSEAVIHTHSSDDV